MKTYLDRTEAGKELALNLAEEQLHPDDTIVLGLARGGMPVAYEVARALGVPLDVLVVRKLGVPGQEELALGAIAPDGVRVLNSDLVASLRISEEEIEGIEAVQQRELERRVGKYRKDMPPLDVENKIVVLVDDGLATGATMRAALKWAQMKGARRRIVAVPVASMQVCQELSHGDECDTCICRYTPRHFDSVGAWYQNFSQVDDETVIELLDTSNR